MLREISLFSLNSKYCYIHPLEKLGIVLISLISCSYTNNQYMILGNIVFFIILNIIAKNPFTVIKRFIGITSTFFIFTAITLLWQRTPIEYIILLALRVLNGAFSIAFLSLTTPINHLVYLFSRSEVLRDIGDIIKSMERFLIIIEDDFSLTFRAIKSRGGFGSFKSRIKDFGIGCGIVFKNLINRWKDINMSMKNRCYSGRYNYSYCFKVSKIQVIGIIIYVFIVIFFNIYL